MSTSFENKLKSFDDFPKFNVESLDHVIHLAVSGYTSIKSEELVDYYNVVCEGHVYILFSG